MKKLLIALLIGLGASLLMAPIARLMFDHIFAQGHFCGMVSSCAFMMYLQFKK